ncbi:hypothetical protein Glove_99g230 [Diversispora epigaea]|uniref:BED-type domain-containing protein n=1 Tax=Diversispora epigaea TaxID=1348612 RepID=A0A397J6E3_9GLOM|nr:hypothetical protein Glove_99g230 [Diversispora epigaea]
MSVESSLQNEDSFDLFPSREISFITDTEEIIGDDLSNFSLSTNNINLVKRKHPGGRKTGEIWNYFIKGKDLGRGLYEAECKACNDKWTRGRPKDMKIHLARNCEKVSDEIRTFWKEIILEEASNVRIQNRKQPQITKHFDNRSHYALRKNKIKSLLTITIIIMSVESSLQNEDSFDLFPSREISFITDTEEIIGDDLSNFSLSTNNINLVKRKHPGGRKTGEIWNYFIKGKDLGRGLYEAECKACNDKWTRGRPKDMKIHLARNCEKVSDEIRTFWKEIILEEASNVQIQNRKQPQITKHFDSITSLPTAKTNELDQAILKA